MGDAHTMKYCHFNESILLTCTLENCHCQYNLRSTFALSRISCIISGKPQCKSCVPKRDIPSHQRVQLAVLWRWW